MLILLWRYRCARILRHPPYEWRWRDAWRFAGGLAEQELANERTYGDRWFTPREAIDHDREYWEA